MGMFCWERKLRRAINNLNSKRNGIHEKNAGVHASLYPHAQFVLFTSATTRVLKEFQLFPVCSHSQIPHVQLSTLCYKNQHVMETFKWYYTVSVL